MWLDDLRPLTRTAGAEDRRFSDNAFRPFGITRITRGGETFPVEETLPVTLPFGRLRCFTRAGGEPSGPAARRRVLVAAPLAGGFPFLMRDLVVALLGIADQVAITDWPDSRYVPLSAGRFGFLENCVETAQMLRAFTTGKEGGCTTHLVGVCQGAVPALVSTLILAGLKVAPASLSLVGGPIDPSRNPTRLWRILQERSLEVLEEEIIEQVAERYPGAGRRVFPAWRQTDTFALYLWRQGMSGGRLPFQLAFDEGADPLLFPMVRLCWSLMDVPGEFFMENVATIFRANDLAEGRLSLDGHRIQAPRMQSTALLTVEGEDDDISAVGQTQAAHDLCVNVPEPLRAHLSVAKAGHFSLFYGRQMREQVVPAMAGIMAAGEAARA